MNIRSVLLGAMLAMLGWAAVAQAAPSSQPASQTEVNFRVPRREYVAVPGEWKILVERSLTQQDSKLASAAQQKLAQSLDEIFAVLPRGPARQLESVTFYLMWGDKSPDGGHRSGMRYVGKGGAKNRPLWDPAWKHAIVIYSAHNLLYLDEIWSKKALMHELAHAWHLMNWPARHPPILDAYNAAKAAGLYLRVKDHKGKLIDKAYATKNQLEYFAEISAMYFVGGNYYPFERSRLVRYDPVGTRLVVSLWQLDTHRVP